MSHEGKGKANMISGIPLAGALSQTDESSVEPNRKEDINAFKEDERQDPYANDYFRDEEKRLNSLGKQATTENEEWSEGLIDEANIPIEEAPALENNHEDLQSELIEDFGTALDVAAIVEDDF